MGFCSGHRTEVLGGERYWWWGRRQGRVVGRRAGKVGLGYIQASGRGTGGLLVTAQGRQGPVGSSGQISLLGLSVPSSQTAGKQSLAF